MVAAGRRSQKLDCSCWLVHCRWALSPTPSISFGKDHCLRLEQVDGPDLEWVYKRRPDWEDRRDWEPVDYFGVVEVVVSLSAGVEDMADEQD